MKIELKRIPIRDIYDGYQDSDDAGVVAFGGKLNVRPAFQREFVYKDAKRDAVIDTVRKGFPLNVMYWCVTCDDTYELLDGQQRTISIYQYIHGDFAIKYQYFHNLTKDEQDQILDYELMIYRCESTDKEKLDWFKIINIAGEQLTAQELRNAIYTGEWLSDAKRYFSKSGGPAYQIGKDYLKGCANRQDYLETAIRWIAAKDDIAIEKYMAIHQHDTNCSTIWRYFNDVINWVKIIFPKYRKKMKGIEWGILFNKYRLNDYDPAALEKEISLLMEDDDISKKSGIYEYIFDKKEKHLNLRLFTSTQKRIAYEKQKGICYICKQQFDLDQMEADHITPWHDGGKTVQENCQMLCKECNRRKSGK